MLDFGNLIKKLINFRTKKNAKTLNKLSLYID